ncbi:hypothetical protein BA746_00330 [Vibrio parahaemolyticus]|uniref:phage major capsid protein n=1 Tax=Vibrio parahaemolyticus TaxID=670 RepID=UPI0006A5E19B|nr:phage major capsid protein [Vibrio parahaemolyticus]KOF30948.1 hypothetical protein ACX04_15935 [Vibrio parahaemolyticus]OTW07815.1 hypothetical protein BA743_16325 [Vibrio parahaemolyticus]OTW23950.1 hypothetical protein BA744_01050 [Vibrio parahaemolyticus]OTW27240.1 hypothetical protein BA746_00330 [Vibrio parahaemolyticus]
MELAQKLEAIVTGVESQVAEINSVKSDIADLKDAFAGLQAANEAVEIKAEDEAEALKTKFYDAVKSGEGFNTELVVDGHIKSFNVTEDTSAGAGVVAQVNRNIVTRILEQSVMGKLFGREVAASTKYEKRVQVGHSGARWEGENVAGVNGEATGTPTFATIQMTHGKAIAKPVVTQEALSDVFFDAEAFVMQDTRKQLGRLISQGLVNGAGANTPKGFMTYFDETEGVKDVATRKVDHYPVLVKTQTEIAEDAQLIEVLRAMQFELKAGYVSGAKYVMSREMFQRVAGLKDGLGRPMMQPSLDKEVAGKLFGFDIVVEHLLPEEKPVVFGRLDEAFKVVEIPTSLGFIRNPYKIDFCVEFTISTRIGTIVNDNEAAVALIVKPAMVRSK